MTTTITASTPGSYTENALAAIPGHTEQVALIDTLKTWQADAWRTTESVTDTAQFETGLAAEIAEAARTGQPAPDLAGRARERLAARDGHRQVVAAYNSAVTTAESQLATMERDGVNDAYQWLRNQLGELFTAFDELDIDPSLTAERALREGRGAAYTSGAELADAYVSLRTAHRHIVHLDPDNAGEDMATLSHKVAVVGQMRDFVDAEPFWAHRRHVNAPRSTDTTEAGQAHRQWLSAAPPSFGRRLIASPKEIVPESITRLAWLAHVAAHRPWLPDAATVIDAHGLAASACRPGRPAVIDPHSRYWWLIPSGRTLSDQQITARDALAELANSTEEGAPTE